MIQRGYLAVRKTAEVALVCATLIVLMYYMSIGYFPFESPSAIAGLAAPVALIGGLGGASFLFLFGAPALMFALIADAGRLDPLVTPFFGKARRQICFARCFAFLVCSQGASGLFVAALFQTSAPVSAAPAFVLALMAFVVGALVYGFADLSSEFFWRRVAAYASVGALASAPLLVMFLLVGSAPVLRDVSEPLATVIYYGVPLACACVGAFALWISLAARVRRDGVILATAALGFVLLAGAIGLGLNRPMLNNLMTAVTLRVPNATLIVTEAACRPLKLRGAKIEAIDGSSRPSEAIDIASCGSAAMPAGPTGSANGRLYRVREVTILSRVGVDWPVELTAVDDAKDNRTEAVDYMVLPRSAIVDWRAATVRTGGAR